MFTFTRTELQSAEALLTESYRNGDIDFDQYASLMEDIAVITRGRRS